MSIRQSLIDNGVGNNKGFRWRGADVSRLEAYSDAVFGFSLTLLVISMSAPRTLDNLLDDVRGLPAFACCFTSLYYIWYCHFIYFRRYGMQDGVTHVLNALLLFAVVFFVYPLKFLYYMVFDLLVFHAPPTSVLSVGVIDNKRLPQLFAVYGIGFWFICAVFGLLYVNAYRQRSGLQLTRREIADTVETALQCFGTGAVGLLSVVVIYVTSNGVLAGIVYTMMSVISPTIHWIMSARRQRHDLPTTDKVADVVSSD